jgi:hypothetical protein
MTDTAASPEGTTVPLFTLEEPPTDKASEALAWSGRTVVLAIKRKRPCFKRGIASSAVVAKKEKDEDIDPEMLTISKDLLDSEALAKITNADNRYRNWLLAYETPCEALAPGMWLFTIRMMERVDQRTTEYIDERKAAVAELREKYAEKKADAEKRLGNLYDETEYPPESELEAAFAVRARWFSLDIKTALKGLSKEEREKVQSRIRVELMDQYEEARRGLRESFAGMVLALQDKLTPDADGKVKALRESQVAKFKDFLKTFNDRDGTGDDLLGGLVEKAQAVLAGVSRETLSDNTLMRTAVQDTLATITTTLTAMDVVSPTRKLRKAGEV